MKIPSLSQCALFACCVAIAACSQAPGIPGLQYTPNTNNIRSQRDSSHHYTVLYAFGKSPDGNAPLASLIDRSGTLYGTTAGGGAYGYGTIFKITLADHEKVLHSFGATIGDGYYPESNLIDVSGLLYGTTSEGGANGCTASLGLQGCGTVFSITKRGTKKVVYSFEFPHGAIPAAGLIDVKGTLYGTTAAGGDYDCYPSSYCGTVFSITTAGKEKVLHSFGKGADGLNPVAGLINVKGTLYGTTQGGGAYGLGTVFSITTAGKEKVLYSFGAHSFDGYGPAAGLIDVGGTLYGTTEGGGAYASCQGTQFATACGTVFSVTTAGQEKVLLSFNLTDGAFPTGGLVNVNGTLYGTTFSGGSVRFGICGEDGCGTVFSISTSGTEHVLHNFGKGSDGVMPHANLIYANGTLYGTTLRGGTGKCRISSTIVGCGTVFTLNP